MLPQALNRLLYSAGDATGPDLHFDAATNIEHGQRMSSTIFSASRLRSRQRASSQAASPVSSNVLLRFRLPFRIYWPSDPPCLTRNRRKHCANALSCGADPCGDPFAGLLVEGFLASEILYPSTISTMSDFHERFGIEVDIEEARQKFINRVCNDIFDNWRDGLSQYQYVGKLKNVLSILGKRYGQDHNSIYYYIDTENFEEVLRAVEAIYKLKTRETQKVYDEYLSVIIAESEIDIGILWKGGQFIPEKIELLDNKLVNDPLKWLRDKGYSTVTTPFQNALSHFLKSEFHPEGLPSVIAEAYKSLEALAKIVLKNRKHLRNNQEQFISNIKGTKFHAKMLRDYIDYGCAYRHAEDTEEPLPEPSKSDVEFFLYYTGMFLRLAMEN